MKLIVSGAFMSTKDDPTKTQLTFDEVRTAVEEATRLGKHVMAHAHATEAIKVAVRAGVRSIEHGSFIDEEAARMMIERGTWLVPTQFIRWYYQQKASPTGPLAKMLELFET
jgi:imidazolonepropionase-like amidohydrolase